MNGIEKHAKLREELQFKIDRLLEEYSDEIGVPSAVEATVSVATYIAKLCAPTQDDAKILIDEAVKAGFEMEEAE